MNAPQLPSKTELEALMKKGKIPGLSMSVIENGEIVWKIDSGLKNLQTKEPIHRDTLFEAASLSKPVFTYGVLKLVEKGELNLDKPLADYFAYSDTQRDERGKYITARMVLAHTSGFPNWRPKNEPLKIHFQPGERFSYSGEGFLYLQKVIEHISGLLLEDYIKKHVFIPLEMIHSTFLWVNDNQKALGHNSDGFAIKIRNVPPNAAFTLHTTATDYAQFVKAILQGIGLKTETFNEMLKVQVQVPVGRISAIDNQFSDSVSWGLGWGLQNTPKGDSFWHWGDNQGVKCFVVGFKKAKRAMVVFTNSDNGMPAISEIIQKYLAIPLPAFDWLKLAYTTIYTEFG